MVFSRRRKKRSKVVRHAPPKPQENDLCDDHGIFIDKDHSIYTTTQCCCCSSCRLGGPVRIVRMMRAHGRVTFHFLQPSN